jgi:hypothetical protein
MLADLMLRVAMKYRPENDKASESPGKDERVNSVLRFGTCNTETKPREEEEKITSDSNESDRNSHTGIEEELWLIQWLLQNLSKYPIYVRVQYIIVTCMSVILDGVWIGDWVY